MNKYYVLFYPGHYAKFRIHHRSQEFFQFLRGTKEIKNITIITPEYVDATNLGEYINALFRRFYRPCESKIVDDKIIEVSIKKVAIPRKFRNKILNTLSFIITYVFIDRFDVMLLKMLLRKVMKVINIKRYDAAFFTSYNSRVGIFLKKSNFFNLLIYKDHDLLANKFESDMIKHADLVVSVGEMMSKLRKCEGARQILTVPHGVNRAKIENIKLPSYKYFDSKNLVTLIYAGSIHPNWGLELAIKAVKCLENKWNLKLLIVGPRETNYFTRLLVLIKNLKLENKIQFLPQAPYEQLLKTLKMGCIGLAPYPPSSPAKYAVPLKVKEYCLAGIPVVTTNLGETGQFIKDTGIGIATNYNPEDYAKAIDTLLANKKLYRLKSLAAIKIAKKYDWNELFKMEWRIIKQKLREVSLINNVQQ